MTEAPRSITFDFFGSLELARRLASFADVVDRSLGERHQAVETALDGWTGPHRDEVARWLRAEHGWSRDVVIALRHEADAWARAWATAADEQNQLRWSSAQESIALEGIPLPVAVPYPAPVSVPIGPDYQPTTSLLLAAWS